MQEMRPQAPEKPGFIPYNVLVNKKQRNTKQKGEKTMENNNTRINHLTCQGGLPENGTWRGGKQGSLPEGGTWHGGKQGSLPEGGTWHGG